LLFLCERLHILMAAGIKTDNPYTHRQVPQVYFPVSSGQLEQTPPGSPVRVNFKLH